VSTAARDQAKGRAKYQTTEVASADACRRGSVNGYVPAVYGRPHSSTNIIIKGDSDMIRILSVFVAAAFMFGAADGQAAELYGTLKKVKEAGVINIGAP
jgi:hypothetical protein